ncbi:glucose-1-phosphate adenylyltransferase, partial [Genlisea aurea]
SVSGARRSPAEKRVAVVSPKAVSDSSSSLTCLDPDASTSVLGIILGGGAGTRLYPLTKKRAKPAVPLGANYRLIDIPVSNCLNSNISKIYVLTQFNSASLNRHLSRAYTSNMGGYQNEGFVEVLAAQQSPENPNWFQGTADAVRQYLWLFEEHDVLEYLILAGDHLYRMDYKKFIQAHRETEADITVAALPMDEQRATAFGLMKINEEGQIIEFAEKPKGDALKAMKVDTTILGLDEARAKEMPFIASMGIYVFSKDVMLKLLQDKFPGANDFGSEVIPGATSLGMRVQAYLYDGYWEDIGTIEAFYNANLGITKKPIPDFSFYDRSSPIYTQPRYLPPSKMLNADVTDSVIGEGCVIKSCKIHHSVIGLRSCILEGAIIEDSLLMGADYYETDADRKLLAAKGGVPVGIGKNTHIKRAIIDKNARIGENVKIINVDDVQESARETDGYFIKSGIVTVIKDALIPSGTTI